MSRLSGNALAVLWFGSLALWTGLILFIAVITEDVGYITLWWSPFVIWFACDMWIYRDKEWWRATFSQGHRGMGCVLASLCRCR